MTTAQICMMASIVVYLFAMVLIGVAYSKKTKNVSDFYLGGRKLGPLVTAMSAEASDMSSYLLMGLPGLALLTGTADVGWTVIGLAVGTYLNWLIVAKKLRNYSAHIGAITIPDYFSMVSLVASRARGIMLKINSLIPALRLGSSFLSAAESLSMLSSTSERLSSVSHLSAA